MLVYLAGIGRTPSATEAFHALAAMDSRRVHRVTTDPVEADIVVFTDLHLLPHDTGLRTLRRHPVYRRFPAKCFVYDERDHPWEGMPGLYVSMRSRSFVESRMVAAPYYTVNRPEMPQGVESDLLFSFVGSRSHPVRDRVLELRHDRAVVQDTTGFVFFEQGAADPRRVHFARVLARSKFVLCPRGAGTASIRLFEALAAGRVPVIISDDWVAPPGPAWGDIAVRLAERDLASAPALLEALEPAWPEMVSAGEAVFDRYFAREASWHNLMNGLAGLVQSGTTGGFARARWSRARLEAEFVHAAWCNRARLRRLVTGLTRQGRTSG